MSAPATIDLGLRIGPGWPPAAPAHLMRALRGVEVTQRDDAPCGFELTFLAELVALGQAFDVVGDPLLQPFNRVLLRVAVNGRPTTLIDGFVTHHRYVPGNGPEDSRFVVAGEDVSVAMDLVDYSREFPALPDAATVATVLAPWLALGLVPEVIPSATSLVPLDYVPQQAETDRALLQRLARGNANVFCVTPTAEPFVNTAYWGPPQRFGGPSAVLDVAVGMASTADAFSAEYDALAPVTYFGLSSFEEVAPSLPIPVVTLESTRMPPLAARPALRLGSSLLTSRKALWREDQLDPIRANLRAQAMTDCSTDAVVTVTAGVRPVRLGQVVSAPGVVGVRGTGEAYDGLYHLKSATHSISLLAGQEWDYAQQLTLTREGVGTTTTTLEAA